MHVGSIFKRDAVMIPENYELQCSLDLHTNEEMPIWDLGQLSSKEIKICQFIAVQSFVIQLHKVLSISS